MMVHIRLFGGPEVRRPEGPVVLTPQQQALLVLLASYPSRGVDRARIIRTIWGAPDDRRTRHRLRQLLHDLRGRIGAAALGPPEADPVRLEGAESDLRGWEEGLAQGRLERCAGLLGRGFASGLRGLPGPAYRDWLDGYRRGLRRRLEERAAAAWDAQAPLGRWREAREAAEALFTVDPANESYLRSLVEARARTGSPYAAEAALASWLSANPDGAAPSPETEDLLARVRALAESDPVQDGPSARRVGFVGRREPRRLLDEALTEVLDGRTRLLLVTGPGGIGKTRLLSETARDARLRGFRVLTANSVEVERQLPLNVLADALSAPEVRPFIAALEEPWRTLVATFLPAHRGIPTLPEVPPVQERALSRRLLDAFSFLVEALAEDSPTLFLLDDLPWADDTSLAVLQSLKRRLPEATLGIVGAARPPRELGRRWPSPYLNQLAALADGRITLEGLGPLEAAELVELTAGGELEGDVRDRLLALGGRNPFFLIELTRDHVAGRLTLGAAESGPPPLPISLQELFEHRLDTLSPAGRIVAEVLAVRGRSLPVGQLAELTGMPLEEAAAAAEELVARRLAEVERGAVSISHELFRAAFYQQVTPARLAVRHLQIAHHLEAHADPPPHGELALHFSRGGEAARAARHGRLAAVQAVESGAVAEAIHLLRIVTENEEDESRKADATAELARLLHVSRDMERAGPLLAVAAEQLRLTGRRAQALRLDIRRVESLVEGAGTGVSEAVARLARIKHDARVEDDWVAVAMALDTTMHLLHQVGDLPAIEGVLEELHACARSTDHEARCLANASLAMNILFGDPEEGLAAAREAVRIAEEHQLREHLLRAQTRLIVVLLYKGQLNLPASENLIIAARRQVKATGDLGHRIMLEANLATFLSEEGRLEEAEATFQGVERAFRSADARVPKFNYLVNRASLARRKFDLRAAARLLREAQTLIVTDLPDYMLDTLNSESGLVALLEGDLSRARSCFESLSGSEIGSLHFDPTTILTFRAAMARRAKAREEALHHIRGVVDRLAGRLTHPWVRAGIIECRLARRIDRLETARWEGFLEAAEALRLQGSLEDLRGL